MHTVSLKGLLVFLLFIFICGIGYGKDAKKNHSITKEIVVNEFVTKEEYAAVITDLKSLKSTIETNQTYITKLDAQNKLMREYHDSLIDMVLWSLGVVVTLAIGLAGFNWWANNKLYESDKAELAGKFDAKIKTLHQSVENSLVSKYNELSTELNRISETYNTTIRAEMTEFRSIVDSLKSELTNLAKLVDKHKAAHEADMTQIRKNIAFNMLVTYGVEEEVWETKDIPENMLLSQIQALEAAIKLDAEYQLKTIPERILDNLEKKFKAPNIKLDSYYKKELLEVLDTKKVDATIANSIRKLLNEVSADD